PVVGGGRRGPPRGCDVAVDPGGRPGRRRGGGVPVRQVRDRRATGAVRNEVRRSVVRRPGRAGRGRWPVCAGAPRRGVPLRRVGRGLVSEPGRTNRCTRPGPPPWFVPACRLSGGPGG